MDLQVKSEIVSSSNIGLTPGNAALERSEIAAIWNHASYAMQANFIQEQSANFHPTNLEFSSPSTRLNPASACWTPPNKAIESPPVRILC